MELKKNYLKDFFNINLYKYMSIVSETLYKYLGTHVRIAYMASIKKDFIVWSSNIVNALFYYKINNLILNQHFYTYYNQNVIGRISRSLNVASKIEIKKLKLI